MRKITLEPYWRLELAPGVGSAQHRPGEPRAASREAGSWPCCLAGPPGRKHAEADAALDYPRCWALILLAGYCGLRQGELLALHPSDVDWLRRPIHVHRSAEKTTPRGAAETKRAAAGR